MDWDKHTRKYCYYVEGPAGPATEKHQLYVSISNACCEPGYFPRARQHMQTPAAISLPSQAALLEDMQYAPQAAYATQATSA
eukprot:1160714-Pelagomonas_calceolata.AAC.22